MPTGLTPDGNASPLWYLRYHLPTRGTVGRQKESALMGRLGALFRPTCTSYAGCAQWDYKAPISNRFISISRHRAAKTSPTGGSTAAGGDRGVFPRAKGAVVWFSTPTGRLACFPTGVSPVVNVFLIHQPTITAN
jgi:hypothetical protein